MNNFKHKSLETLADQQVRYAPPECRQIQLVEAQKLLGEVKLGTAYPYAYICFRLTGFHSKENADLLIEGIELQNDLNLVVRRLEKSIPALPIEDATEPMLTLEEISRKFNVSTKTISRWRVRGLVGNRVIMNGRRQLAFPQSIVESFLNRHRDRVAKSGRFSHLTAEEKAKIIRNAARYARAGASLTETSRRIARRLQRSVEAIRYTIRNFDQENPPLAIFLKPVGVEMNEDITTERKGLPMNATLAKKYGREQNPAFAAKNELRAESLLKAPVDYIYNADFDDTSKESEILSRMPGEDKFQVDRLEMKAPRDVPPELASLYEWPLLTREQEAHQFRLMNFLKHKLHKHRQTIDANQPRVREMRHAEDLRLKIQEVKSRLINCNMRLVASIAKKHSLSGESLFELISDGNISLIRAVEKFDYGRGFKFSTYGSWALIKNFARSIPEEKKHRDHYMTGAEEIFDARADVRTDEQEMIAQAELARHKVNVLLEGLDPRTREVIRMRNGLDGSSEMTLEQIGKHFGITKERVRQINVRGMKQLRERALTHSVELPA